MESIRSKIRQRRYQMLVHSYLYYRRCTSIISDEKFDRWARELVKLQHDYPEIAATVNYAEAFAGFDATTGYDLPYSDHDIQQIGEKLIAYKGERP